MDTQTGETVDLAGPELVKARQFWAAFEAGLLKKQPRFVPVEKDRPARGRLRLKSSQRYRALSEDAKPGRREKPGRGSKVKRTYRAFCR